MENVLRLANHLTRDGRLIIDAILEHAFLMHEGSG
jgi:hypothetical protein